MISIAMTTYNGEKYLREQLNSIFNQTVQDFEMIVCDDCSKDSTWQILEEYACKDSRVRIFKNEHNLGFKKNFEKAISLCKGEYVALCDQDDVWLPTHISTLLNNLGNKSISCGNAVLIDSDGNDMHKLLNEIDGGFVFMPEGSKLIWRIVFNGNPFQGASMMMPVSFFKKSLPIPENVNYHDAWFSACACFEGGVSYTFDPVTKYRQHGNNVTYSYHNKDTRTFFQKVKSKLSIFFGCSLTDRFCYVSELEKRYGMKNVEFNTVKLIVDNIAAKRFTFKDVILLWKNYFYIATQKNHKKFLKRIMIWKRWQPFDVDKRIEEQ